MIEQDRGGREDRDEEGREARVLDRERPVERGHPGQVGDPRQEPHLERDQEQHGREREVEERLDHERRAERRVGRPGQPVLRDVELHDVAAARGRDRVHGHAAPVREEHRPERDPELRVRGADDVLPPAHARGQAEEVEQDREQERPELHRGEVPGERLERVDEGA